MEINSTQINDAKHATEIPSSYQQFNKLQIIFWNVHGLSNLYNEPAMLEYDIVCAYETWLATNVQHNSPPWSEYITHSSPAIKLRSSNQGRASGGILSLVKKNVASSIEIDNCNFWIFSLNTIEDLRFIVGVLYIRPSYDLSIVLESLEILLNELSVRFSGLPILIGGDFNARVGVEDTQELLCNMESSLDPKRCSLDTTVTPRGKDLYEFMNNNGFVLLNGRSIGDILGNFTFSNKNGNSVVDLVYVNVPAIPYIDNFEVLPLATGSDHFPVLLKLKVFGQSTVPNNPSPALIQKIKLKWDGAKASEFAMLTNQIFNNDDLENSFKILNVDQQNKFITDSIQNAAKNLNMATRTTSKPRTHISKPWFDSELKSLKAKLNKDLKTCKRSLFDQNSKSKYLETKGAYKALLKVKRIDYETNIKKQFYNIKNSKDFWSLINSFRQKPIMPNPIQLETWKNFYSQIYPPRPTAETLYIGTTDNILDSEITLHEVDSAVKKLKNNKSPGEDKISAEFFKHLSNEGLVYLQTLFNNIIQNGITPEAWSRSILILFHKKGDVNLPDNYRGIALCNVILKIFTHILHDRLLAWAEGKSVIPESQNGFRKRRSCVDNIFTLQATLQHHLRLKKNSAFGLFIDFKRAFDSLVQFLLWQKLYSIGVSARFIRILQSIYDRASFVIRLPDCDSDPISVTEGVLQGEVLSPLLFSLFISDFESELRSSNIEGLNIDGINDILTLLFADDAVVLARSPVMLRKILQSLESYCEKNKLVVNTDKTQIVHFRKGGRASSNTFTYKNQPIAIVKTYTYLGVTFSSSTLGKCAADAAIKKSKMALGSTLQTISAFKSDSWDGRVKLFNSTVAATLLYSIEVWGLNYCEQVEVVQSSYYKRLLSLPKSTPNAPLRLEFGLIKLKYEIFKRAYDLVVRVLAMETRRYPKICLLRLISLHQNNNLSSELNWVSQLNKFLELINMNHLWNSTNVVDWTSNREVALERFQRHLKFTDTLRASNSNSMNCRILRSLDDAPAPYLNHRNLFYMAKTIAQLRLSSKYVTRFTFNGHIYKLELDQLCTLCNLQENETLFHFIFECPIYSALRNHYLGNLLYNFSFNKYCILNCTDPQSIRSLYYYIKSCLRLRSFLLND